MSLLREHRALQELVAGWTETATDLRRLWHGAPATDVPAGMPRAVACQQFRALLRETPANIAATLLAGVLWGTAFWWMGATSYLVLLLLSLVAVAMVCAVYVGFRRARPTDDALGVWEERIQRSIFASGLVWASAILVPAPSWTIPYVAMGALLMVAGGFSLFATYRPGISLYAMPFQVITSASLMAKGGPLGIATGIGFAVAVGVMVRIARAHNTSITQAMRVAEERKILLDELGVQRREAERANLAKTVFLASVTHDLRQPLHSIALLASAARMRGTADAVTVEQIDVSVQSMEALLAALLEASRLDSGSMALDVAVFSAAEMLERVRLQFDPQARAKGLRFEILASKERIRSDAFQLERIVSNLVANAIRYTRCGGVHVRCRRRGATLWLQVWDSGVGIARRDRLRVFEDFFQVRRGKSASGQGIGLGLGIARRAAQRLGHALRVRSRVGRGTLFEIGVPIVLADAGQAGEARLAPSPGGAPGAAARGLPASS